MSDSRAVGELGETHINRALATSVGVLQSKMQYVNMAMPTGLRSSRKAPPMARDLGKRHRKTKKLRVPSVTMGVALYVDSLLERTAVLALDVDPRCREIASQPLSIRLDLLQTFATQSDARKAYPPIKKHFESDRFVYTPDLRVDCNSSSQYLIEVKYKNDLDHIEDEIEALRKAIPRIGYRFIVVTDEHVGHEFLDLNLIDVRDAIKLLRDQPNHPAKEMLADAVRIVRGSVPFNKLVPKLPTYFIAIGLASGILGCDLRAGKLGSNTLVWPAFGDLSHLQIIDLGG